MKKLYSIALASSLFLLGSCASDAPEIANNVDDGEQKGMHIALTFTNADETRATANEVEGNNESKINRLQLIILNEEGGVYFDDYIEDATALASGVATFSISNAQYEDMITKQGRGAKMKILVYVNGSDASSTQILNEATPNPTWGVQTLDGKNTKGFTMSNSEDCEGFAEVKTTSGEAADGSASKPWLIKANVKLTRLASRFDYNTTASDGYKDTYTATYQTSVTLDNIEFAINTFANTTYRIAHFSKDGNVQEDWSNYAISGNNKYRVTDSFTAGTTVGSYTPEFPRYSAHDYILTKSTPNTYKRPNTVSKVSFKKDGNDLTVAQVKADKAFYKKVPYAAVRAQFHVENYAGTGEASRSMVAHEAVFAVNGIFIGGVKDIRHLKELGYDGNTKLFEITYDESAVTTAVKADIDKIEENINTVLGMRFPSDIEANAEKLDTDEKKLEADENWLQKNLGQAEKYICSKDDSGNFIGYYTYYASLIQHSSSTDPADYFGISRNHVYSLVVKSFKMLGNNGSGYPGDGPKESDLTDMNMQLSVTVDPWQLVLNAWDL